MKEALVEKTFRVIDSISRMECIKPYILVGGTALSLQLKHRMSEDLDFMTWQKKISDKTEIAIREIKKEIEQSHKIEALDILEFNHIQLYVDEGVKLSFYFPEKRQPLIEPVIYRNNLRLANIECLAALKMEVLMRRNEFRDYYDLYCIMKDLDSSAIRAIISNALTYSGHNLKSKNLTGMLTNSKRFEKSEKLTHLFPKYSVSAKEIEELMIEKLKNLF